MNYINKKDFTLEELKFIRALLSVDKFKGFTNPIYKSILDKLEYKIDSIPTYDFGSALSQAMKEFEEITDKMISEGITPVYSDVLKDVYKKYNIK